MDKELENIKTMIGCTTKEFDEVIDNSIGKIWMSTGSWYTPYVIYDDKGILARFESNGKKVYIRDNKNLLK